MLSLKSKMLKDMKITASVFDFKESTTEKLEKYINQKHE
jgi:hypothetical protein